MSDANNKVIIDLGVNGWHGYATETVWAEFLGEDLFRIRNVPFYAKELSVEDIVSTEYRDGKHHLKFITKRGGHSTYRIFLSENVTDELFVKFWMPLLEIGCTYEKNKRRLYAIDVPPMTDIYKVYSLLEEGEKSKVWEFEEGHCGHPVNTEG